MNLASHTVRSFPLLLCVILFWSPVPSRAQDDTRRQIDSIRGRLPELTGEQRQWAYGKLKSLYMAGDQQEYSAFLTEYLVAAQRFGDTEMEGWARVARVSYYNNNNMVDSMRGTIGAHLDFFARSGQWDKYFFSAQSEVFLLLYSVSPAEALTAANRMYERAKAEDNQVGVGMSLSTIGTVSHAMEKIPEAEAAYREALDIFARSESPNKWGFIFNTSSRYVRLLIQQEKYEEGLRVCLDNEVQIPEIKDGMDYSVQLFSLYYEMVKIYTALGRFDEAETYLAHARELRPGQMKRGRQQLQTLEYTLLNARGDYGRALAVASQEYDEELAAGDQLGAYSTLSHLGEIAYRAKEYNRSAEAFQRLRVIEDSLRTKDNLTALDELRTKYEVDKLEAQKRAQRNYLLLALGLCVLLIVALVIWILYSRKLKTRNHGLVRRLQEQDRLMSELTQAQENIRKLRSLVKEGLTSSDTESEIYMRLMEVMKDREVYTNPDVSRESVARMLATNEKYLHETVRRYFGMSFSEYIASLRLNLAREMLREDASYTIEAVAVACGFGSRNTFHRLFREQYGLTPDEYRRISAHIVVPMPDKGPSSTNYA